MNGRAGHNDRRRTITALLVSVTLHGAVVLWIALAGSHDGSRYLTPGGSSYEAVPPSITVGIVPARERPAAPSGTSSRDGEPPEISRPNGGPPAKPVPDPAVREVPKVPEGTPIANPSPPDHDGGSQTALPSGVISPPGHTLDGTIPPVDLVPDSGVGGTRDAETVVSGERRADRSLPAEPEGGPTVVRVDATPLEPIDPVYPLSARRRGIEGEVLVEAAVSATGTVIDASIIRSSRNRRLDEAAVSAVRGTPFAPARVGDRPRSGTARVRVVFSLD